MASGQGMRRHSARGTEGPRPHDRHGRPDHTLAASMLHVPILTGSGVPARQTPASADHRSSTALRIHGVGRMQGGERQAFSAPNRRDGVLPAEIPAPHVKSDENAKHIRICIS